MSAQNGMLSAVIEDLQMIFAQVGDVPVYIASKQGPGELGAIRFGGMTVLENVGGQQDGANHAILFGKDLQEEVIEFVQQCNGGKEI